VNAGPEIDADKPHSIGISRVCSASFLNFGQRTTPVSRGHHHCNNIDPLSSTPTHPCQSPENSLLCQPLVELLGHHQRGRLATVSLIAKGDILCNGSPAGLAACILQRKPRWPGSMHPAANKQRKECVVIALPASRHYHELLFHVRLMQRQRRLLSNRSSLLVWGQRDPHHAHTHTRKQAAHIHVQALDIHQHST
jgi:hypothetical protein